MHSFYCVLALLLLNLLRRKLAKAGIPLSVVEMMDTLTDIYEVTLLYPRRIWLQEALRANRPRGHGPGAAQNRREPRPRALSQRVVIQPSTRHDRASRGLESCSLSGGGKLRLVRQKYPRLIYPGHPRARPDFKPCYPGGGGYAGLAFNMGYTRAMLPSALAY